MEHTHFAIGRQSQRLGRAVTLAGVLEAALIVGAVLVSHRDRRVAAMPGVDDRASAQLVWLADSGPGGGGGGGGNHMAAPPRPVEAVGHDRNTVPTRPVLVIEAPRAAEDRDWVNALTIPSPTLAASLENMPGATGVPSVPGLSQGPGSGGGAGDGDGRGSGPDTGDGLGKGRDHGIGDGPFAIGGDVLAPRELTTAKPVYTAEAMRARIQGSVVVECIVQPSGVCTDIQIERSLDRTFGLDQAAVDSVKRWKFRPGTRRGQAVPVLVRIEVDFTIR